MLLLPTPTGRVEYTVVGRGDPVTVFAHGLGGSIPDTRPFGSGVTGTRVFFHFRGHGRSISKDKHWGYDELAADLIAVADHVGATHALGVSLGAGALCRLVEINPDRFDRLVFVLPSVVGEIRSERVRRRLTELAAAVRTGSTRAVAALVYDEIPPALHERPEVAAYVQRRAQTLLSVQDELLALRDEVAVEDRSALARVRVPALVIGSTDDPLHDGDVARDLAAALPDGRLHVFDERGFVWTHRTQLRELISGFLAT